MKYLTAGNAKYEISMVNIGELSEKLSGSWILKDDDIQSMLDFHMNKVTTLQNAWAIKIS